MVRKLKILGLWPYKNKYNIHSVQEYIYLITKKKLKKKKYFFAFEKNRFNIISITYIGWLTSIILRIFILFLPEFY